MVKAIVFDYDGVIFPDEYAGIRSLCSDESAIIDIEKRYYDKPRSDGFWDDIKRYFSLSISSNELRKHYNSETIAQKNHEKEMMEYIKTLSPTYRLVLLSNQISDRTEYLRQNKQFDIFEKVFFSSEIGLQKPDRTIFNFVLTKLKLSPEECIFIDDDEINITASKELGIKGIRFQSLLQLKELGIHNQQKL